MNVSMLLRLVCLGVAISLSLVAPVRAVSLSITNPGFEMQFVGSGTFNDDGPPTGWSAYDPDGIIGHNYSSLGVLNPTDTDLYPGGAPQGDNVALIFLWPYAPHTSDAGKPAGIQQTLTSTLLANTQYTLTVQVGNIAVGPAAPFDLNGFPGYQVQLLAGGQLLAQDNDTLNPAEGQFLLSTVQFTTGATHDMLGEEITIRLVNLNGPSGIEVNYDDVQLDASAVPEPGAMALMAAGALIFAARFLRRTRPGR